MRTYITVVLIISLSLAFVVAARLELALSARALLFLSIAALLAAALIPGHRNSRDYLQTLLRKKPAWLPAFLALPLAIYLLSALPTAAFSGPGFLLFALFILAPALIAVLTNRLKPELRFAGDLLAAAALWIPFDHRWYTHFWAPGFPIRYETVSLVVVFTAAILFISFRRLEGVGYHLVPTRRDFLVALPLLALVAVVLVPVGLSTGFLEFAGRVRLSVPEALLAFAGIFLTIAIVEEIIFRGIIQNVLEKKFNKHFPALLIASALFGLAHWNNAGPDFRWHYIFLATLAGAVYGTAYKKTGSLFAAILVHTLVDLAWLALFVK